MQRDGIAPPEVLVVQPKISVGLLMYLEAFYELDTERNHGMSLARIPWSSIMAYADRYQYDGDEMLFFIRKMDDAWLEKLAAAKAGGGNGGSTGPGEVVQRPPRPD
jgi:hypothetical protein